MQTTRPRITWKVFNSSGAIFKKYSIKCEKDLDCELFYSELKRTTSHIIFTILTQIIFIVLENDNTVLIKGLKKGCKC